MSRTGIPQPKMAGLRKRLLQWFDREKRTLPWREENDPYRILVSEVMLQQTRVAVVEERYRKFLRQFPTIQRLARARQQTVLAAWSGLGYYRRARALHAAARQVARAGSFPQTSTELRKLPGVGRYTANAVASIAFGEPAPVVDGNVKRVLERLTGSALSEEQCWEAAGRLLHAKRPGDFNQAMMELGALVCLPGKPLCSRCPLVGFCAWRGVATKPAQARRKRALLNCVLARRNGSVFLEQRSSEGSLMPSMWELPVAGKGPGSGQEVLLELRHAITTTDYHVLVFSGKKPLGSGRWVPLRSAGRLPLTGLARKILDRLNLL